MVVKLSSLTTFSALLAARHLVQAGYAGRAQAIRTPQAIEKAALELVENRRDLDAAALLVQFSTIDQAILRRRADGESYQAIGAALGIAPITVQKRHLRIQKWSTVSDV